MNTLDLSAGVLTCGLKGSGERFGVQSLADARGKYVMARDASGEGASGWPPAVIYRDGVRCARISYNGRVWGNDGAEIALDAPAVSPDFCLV